MSHQKDYRDETAWYKFFIYQVLVKNFELFHSYGMEITRTIEGAHEKQRNIKDAE